MREVQENLLPLAQLADLLERTKDISLVYRSSGGVLYGDQGHLFDESMLSKPLTYYGAGKAAAEAVLNAFTQQSSHRVSILRPSSIYGPGQVAKPGFGLIPTLLDRITRGESFELFRHGRDRRDFLYIGDLVEAMLAAPNCPPGIYNVGSGMFHSVLEVVRKGEEATRTRAQIVLREDTLSPAQSVELDTSSIRRAFSWTPRTSLVRGLKEIHDWWNIRREGDR